MSKELIERFIDTRLTESGMVETSIKGVKIFKITEAIRCAPAIYEPSVTAIVSGCKEAVWNGNKHYYDNSKYISCTMSMPIEAGTLDSSQDNPLIGVYISIDTQMMTELVIEMESTKGAIRIQKGNQQPQGLLSANWENNFSDALYRLLQLEESPTDIAILSKSRLRELYYAILKGESGYSFRRTFDIGNEIARSIEYLSFNLSDTLTIEDMADHIGMSRAVFHRKFKQATNMSPIQFVKSMRLNSAAMKISEGTNVNVAAMEVGYVSSSQFSREFKRMYGVSPKQWSQTKKRIESVNPNVC